MKYTAAERPDRQLSRHYFPLVWLLLASFSVFALYVAWDADIMRLVFAHDRSHIALLIVGLAVAASSHAAWHILLYSDRIDALMTVLDRRGESNSARRESPFIKAVLDDLAIRQAGQRSTLADSELDSLIEIHADRLRSPVELGWFLVDLAVRLGLVGTIIGFILIFTSLSDTTDSGADGIKALLVSMSGGMGTALFTTLTGLIAASLLGMQYLILGRTAETLIGLLIRLRVRQDEPSMAGAGTPCPPAGSDAQQAPTVVQPAGGT